MKHKVGELEGAQLDGAVALAEGISVEQVWRGPSGEHRPGWSRWDQSDGIWRGWNPSTDWRDGGPIIERERIATSPPDCVGDYGEWKAFSAGSMDRVMGPTLLIAAMRAYVASKLGEEVDI